MVQGARSGSPWSAGLTHEVHGLGGFRSDGPWLREHGSGGSWSGGQVVHDLGGWIRGQWSMMASQVGHGPEGQVPGGSP